MPVLCGNCKEYHPSVEDVRECHGLFPTPLPSEPDAQVPITIPTYVVHDPPPLGSFTFIWGDDEAYKTIDIKEWKARPGCFVISFLNGPDNSRDFMGFGEWDDGKYKIWNRYKHNADLVRIMDWLSQAEGDQWDASGEMYAMRSERCRRCYKKLTVPSSLHRGYGPECITKVGT